MDDKNNSATNDPVGAPLGATGSAVGAPLGATHRPRTAAYTKPELTRFGLLTQVTLGGSLGVGESGMMGALMKP